MTAVLFTCAGQRVDIVSEFDRAGATTIVADANPLAPALYAADHQLLLPRVDDPGYVDALARTVTEHDVRLIVPLTDLDHVVLARERVRLTALGALVLLPALDVVELCGDKYLAHLRFLELGLPSPPTWLPADLPPGAAFPLLVKARRGFGSRDIYTARDRRELDFFLGYTQAPSMIQQRCAGLEYSIDVFCDLRGRCLNAIPRTMIESKGGESIKGQTVRDSELIDHGRRVAEALGLVGPATIQCFREPDGSLPITDINPRFGGAFPLPSAAGSRYAELAIALAIGDEPEPRLGEFTEGIVMTRFFSHVTLADDGTGLLRPVAEGLREPLATER